MNTQCSQKDTLLDVICEFLLAISDFSLEWTNPIEEWGLWPWTLG